MLGGWWGAGDGWLNKSSVASYLTYLLYTAPVDLDLDISDEDEN